MTGQPDTRRAWSVPEELHGGKKGDARGDQAAQLDRHAQFHRLGFRPHRGKFGLQSMFRFARLGARGSNFGHEPVFRFAQIGLGGDFGDGERIGQGVGDIGGLLVRKARGFQFARQFQGVEGKGKRHEGKGKRHGDILIKGSPITVGVQGWGVKARTGTIQHYVGYGMGFCEGGKPGHGDTETE